VAAISPAPAADSETAGISTTAPGQAAHKAAAKKAAHKAAVARLRAQRIRAARLQERRENAQAAMRDVDSSDRGFFYPRAPRPPADVGYGNNFSRGYYRASPDDFD
jgi:hypothetical protein